MRKQPSKQSILISVKSLLDWLEGKLTISNANEASHFFLNTVDQLNHYVKAHHPELEELAKSISILSSFDFKRIAKRDERTPNDDFRIPSLGFSFFETIQIWGVELNRKIQGHPSLSEMIRENKHALRKIQLLLENPNFKELNKSSH